MNRPAVGCGNNAVWGLPASDRGRGPDRVGRRRRTERRGAGADGSGGAHRTGMADDASAAGLSKVREELAHRDHQVVLSLLWQEYKAAHPEGYPYSQSAERYRRFEKKLSVVLRKSLNVEERVASLMIHLDLVMLSAPVRRVEVGVRQHLLPRELRGSLLQRPVHAGGHKRVVAIELTAASRPPVPAASNSARPRTSLESAADKRARAP